MQENQVSEFNENANKIQRLHNYWLEIAKARHRGNFGDARWLLDTVESELKYEAKRIDKANDTKYVADLKEINTKLNNTRKLFLVYRLILEKEELLREVQQEIGMGTTYKDPDEDEMD